MWVFKTARNLSLALALTFAFSAGAMASLPRSAQSSEGDSLAVQMARRMILLRDKRPVPSLGYQLSTRLVRQKQAIENNQKYQKTSGKPAAKKTRPPHSS